MSYTSSKHIQTKKYTLNGVSNSLHKLTSASEALQGPSDGIHDLANETVFSSGMLVAKKERPVMWLIKRIRERK